jgi:hypothetical protein
LNKVLGCPLLIEFMTRLFVTGAAVMAVVFIAACASDNGGQPKKDAHKFGTPTPAYSDLTPTPAPTAPAEETPTPALHHEVTPPAGTEVTKTGDVPYATPVAGKPGFVTSPYSPYAGYVDVRGFPPGTEVKCPYTGKIFLVP